MWSCVGARWAPVIGDPSFMGWLTVIAYLVAGGWAFIRAIEAFAAVTPEGGELRFLWLGLSMLLVLLAINKQLDLQSALTAAGRCMSLAQGWYDERGAVQMAFAAFIAGGAISVFALVLLSFRRHLRALFLVLTGLFILATFIVLRATSMHQMDVLIGARVLGLKMNWIIELGALALISIGAAFRPRPNAQGQLS